MVTSPLPAKNSYPSSTTWCALTIKSKSWSFKNWLTVSDPKETDTPRSFGPKPAVASDGSDQSRSQRNPESGMSAGLCMALILFRKSMLGSIMSCESPPCMQITLSAMRAQAGM
eukprot:Skav226543  [mRNA]  locus=scaffold421:73152:74333:- [translate_table: standard]